MIDYIRDRLPARRIFSRKLERFREATAMNIPFTPRDYSLTGPAAQQAEELGLVSAEWHRAPIPRKRLKELMQRSDGPAIRDTIVWIAAFLVAGGLAFHFWPGWLALPFFIAY